MTLRTTSSIQLPKLPASEEQKSQRKLALEKAARGRGQRSAGGDGDSETDPGAGGSTGESVV
jgi:hypothetical protein